MHGWFWKENFLHAIKKIPLFIITLASINPFSKRLPLAAFQINTLLQISLQSLQSSVLLDLLQVLKALEASNEVRCAFYFPFFSVSFFFPSYSLFLLPFSSFVLLLRIVALCFSFSSYGIWKFPLLFFFRQFDLLMTILSNEIRNLCLQVLAGGPSYYFLWKFLIVFSFYYCFCWNFF